MKKYILAAAMATLMAGTANAAKIGVSMALFDDNFLTVLRNGMIEQAKGMKALSCRSKTPATTLPSSLTRSRTSRPQALTPSSSTRLTPRPPRPCRMPPPPPTSRWFT